MEEDIKILENLKEKTYTTEDILGNLVLDEEEYTALQNLITRYKELEEDKKDLQKYMKNYLIPKSTINLVYIPKSKIKEIIQENSINIIGFWCVPTDDLQKLLED